MRRTNNNVSAGNEKNSTIAFWNYDREERIVKQSQNETIENNDVCEGHVSL